MNSTTKEQRQIRQYLLGNLQQASATRLEQRILDDKAFYEEVQIVEGELIDQHLAGKLSANEHEDFVSYFLLAPERQYKLRFSSALKRYIDLNQTANSLAESAASGKDRDSSGHLSLKSLFRWPSTRTRFATFSLVVGLCLTVVAVSWVVFKGRSSQISVPERNQSIVTVALIAGSTRADGSTKRVVIPPATDFVRLELELTRSDYQSYSAELLTIENVSLRVSKGLKAEATAVGQNTIVWNIPAEILKHGDYQVRISGVNGSSSIELIDTYRFRVDSR